ncbi:PepSY domain-containing protein [Streptomyces sp. JH34]|uniref:PepSY domain-containing protein n=1 Tax=Streptomyces sp. JH34 TaxID=2793633 RepID=UPI0023FA2462|nr:PepSY domain-containing protein [Streptomyces sp. JH34]MDF6022912.1 PepSY domain-containing protein [Streptomyces sp. JH34]
MRFEPRRNKTASPRTRRLRVAGGALCAVALAAALVTGCGQNSGDDTAAETSEAAKVLPNQTTSPSGSPSGTASLTQDQTERKDLLSTVKVTFDTAATTAVGEVSGGKLTDLDLEGLDDEDDASGSPSPSGTSSSPSPEGSASPSGTGSASPSGSGSPSPSGSSSSPKWIAEVAEEDGTAHKVTIDAVSGDVIDSAPDADQSDADKKALADQLSQATQTPQQAAKVATDKQPGWVTSVGLDENDSKVLVWQVDVVSKDWNKTTFDVDAAKGTITDQQVDDD